MAAGKPEIKSYCGGWSESSQTITKKWWDFCCWFSCMFPPQFPTGFLVSLHHTEHRKETQTVKSYTSSPHNPPNQLLNCFSWMPYHPHWCWFPTIRPHWPFVRNLLEFCFQRKCMSIAQQTPAETPETQKYLRFLKIFLKGQRFFNQLWLFSSPYKTAFAIRPSHLDSQGCAVFQNMCNPVSSALK